MDWVAEVTISGAGGAARGWGDDLAKALAGTEGLTAFDRYTPAEEADGDPLNPAEVPPDLVTILTFESEDALRAACARPLPAPPGTATTAAFARRFYPVPGGDGGHRAPISYLVRYELPCADADAFRRIYTDGHPEVQARLPGIRTIVCDLPITGLGFPGLPNANWLIGNEVAFDSADAFASAMQSPARTELRAHMADFPDWSGVNHHHLMQRERVFP